MRQSNAIENVEGVPYAASFAYACVRSTGILNASHQTVRKPHHRRALPLQAALNYCYFIQRDWPPDIQGQHLKAWPCHHALYAPLATDVKFFDIYNVVTATYQALAQMAPLLN